MRCVTLIGTALAALAAIAPAQALAATVAVERGAFTVGEGVYTAGAGEANRLTASFEQGNLAFTVHDPGAVIMAGEHCESIDAHTARCVAPELTFGPTPRPDWVRAFRVMKVTLGDMSDTFGSSADGNVGVLASGGRGDDVLEGPSSRNSFDGGGGRDRLIGGEYDDELTDGDRSGAGDADYLDGGGGEGDTLVYQDRTDGVTIDLHTRIAGEPGEGDTVRGFDQVIAGAGDDNIIGTDDPDRLYGADGDDEISARAGTDTVEGGDGIDRLVGGSDSDGLDGGRGVDAYSCGGGEDGVRLPDRDELLEPPCEMVEVGPSTVMPAHPLRVTGRAVFLDPDCPYHEDEGDLFCHGALKLHEATGKRRLLARTRFRGADPVRVGLTALGRRLIRRRSGFVGNVAYRSESDPDFGVTGKANWAIRVRRDRG